MRLCLMVLVIACATVCSAEDVTWSFEIQGTATERAEGKTEPLKQVEVRAYPALRWGQYGDTEFKEFQRTYGPLPQVVVTGTATTNDKGEFTLKGTAKLTGDKVPRIRFEDESGVRQVPVCWVTLVVQTATHFGLGSPSRTYSDSMSSKIGIECSAYGTCRGRAFDTLGQSLADLIVVSESRHYWIPEGVSLPSTKTGPDGRFELSVPAIWSMDLAFEGRLRASSFPHAVATSSDMLSISPGKTVDVGDVTLALPSSVKARVVDGVTGKDLSDVSFTFSPGSYKHRSYYLIGSGACQFTIPAGTYTLKLFHNNLKVGKEVEVRAKPNEVTDLGDLKIYSAVTLKILVVDDQGTPLERANVFLTTPDERYAGGTAKWDEEGFYAIKLDPSLSWNIEVLAHGLLPLKAPLVLEPKDTELTVKLVREASAEIEVTPIEGSRAYLRFAMLIQPGTPAEEMLNKAGAKAVEDSLDLEEKDRPQGVRHIWERISTTPGKWILLARIEDEAEYYRVDLDLKPGENDPVVIKQRGANIRIRCVEGTKALANTQIFLSSHDHFKPIQATTDKDGWLELKDRLPGTWYVFKPDESLDDKRELEARRVELSLGANADVTVDLTYKFISVVTFVIKATNCEPDRLYIWDEAEFVQADLRDRFREFDQGQCAWGVIEPGRYFALLGQEDGDYIRFQFVCEFVVGGPGHQEIELKGEPRFVRGKVDLAGLPPGAEVSVLGSHLAFSQYGMEDGASASDSFEVEPDGSFSIRSIGLHDLRLQAMVTLPDGNVMYSPAVLVPQGRFPHDLVLKPVAAVGALVLELKLPGGINDSVVRVHMRDAVGNQWLLPRSSQFVAESHSVRLFPFMPVGKWDLVVEATGAQTLTLKDIEITKEVTAFHTVNMSPACELLISHPELSKAEAGGARVELLDERGNVLSTGNLYHRSMFAALSETSLWDDAEEVETSGLLIVVRDRRVAKVRLIVPGYKPYEDSVNWQKPGRSISARKLEAK